MPLTAAERQRRYRQKLKSTNPEKFQDQKKKNSERTLQKYKNKTDNFSEKQKEERRRKWREDRQKKDGVTLSSQQPTVENSNQNMADIQTLKKIENENIELKRKLSVVMKSFTNIRKKVQRQQLEIESLNKKYNNITMKLEAIETKAKDQKETENITDYMDNTLTEETPNKRATEFINRTIPNIETPKKEEIKKKLIEHDVFQESFKNEFKNSTMTDKNVFKRVLNSNIMKKYKKTTKFKVTLGLQASAYKKIGNIQKKKYQLQKIIATFYNRDDVSRATAGKKEYKTYKKVKFQKRYLLDKLKNLHKKYVEEEGTLSFSTFKKYRPFYVLPPNIKDCESCACVKHSNMQFMIDKLNSFGLLKTNILNDVVSELVCDFKSKHCMYGDCPDCSQRHIDNGEIDSHTQVKWFKWALKEYEYGKEGDMKKSKKMMKTENEGTLKDLLETFNKEVKAFKKHVFNFYYQYKQYKQCIENLQEHEALIHIDFSENYVCKYYQEVQAKHFVKDQITLHTGVLYLKNEKPISFCSISPDNTHNPEAIWGHLNPVLNYVKNEHPNISTTHFFSDGPATQYRQKKNFFLFSQNIYDYGFTHSSWSFFEAAHGKGAADGVGGAIKRTLDMKTAQGLDIPDAMTAYDALLSTETKIKIFYVPTENIKPIDPLIVEKLTPISGTMKIHQLITCEKYKINYRDLSCFCKDIREACACHSPKYHDFSTLNELNQSKRNRKRSGSVNNGNATQKSPKKVKRHRNQSISSSEDDTDIEIEYAESDADDVFWSDFSMVTDFEDDENVPNDNLNNNSSKITKRIDPNKKIDILSTIILKKPFQSSNSFKSQNEDNMTKKLDPIDKENYADAADICKSNKDEKKVTEIVDSELKNNDEIKTETIGGCKMKKDEETKTEAIDVSKMKEDEEKKTKTMDICKIKEDEVKNTKTMDVYKMKEHEAKKSNTMDVCKMKEDEEKNTNTMDVCKMKEDEEKNTKTMDVCKMKEDEEKMTETMTVSKMKEDEEKKVNPLADLRTNENFDKEILQVDHSVIVRYYERKKWKYYIGFIIEVINKNEELFYKIRFLKTIKNPTIKFLVTKKIDIDIVPSMSVVKRIHLIPQEEEKQYIIKDDFDYVYFSDS